MAHIKTQLVVLGSGPGGYSAAFRAADLGLDVTLVERHPTLGGVCLNVGCIPSKALLHVAEVINEAEHADSLGLSFGKVSYDLDKVRAYKESVVGKLVSGVGAMAKGRKVRIVEGYGRFVGTHQLEVDNQGEKTTIEFEKAIIAAGSRSVKLSFIPEDPRIWDSTSALELRQVPQRLLVIGGGIIGLEMATVYEALGSKVTVVEFADQLVPAADKDLIAVYTKHNKDRFEVLLSTKVEAVAAKPEAIEVSFSGAQAPAEPRQFDAVLVAVGRSPNGKLIDADKAGVTVDERGFIPVDEYLQTNQPHIWAIGDIVGQPMLAHKATHEGHAAAEGAAGHPHAFHPIAIPSIAYTSPEIAWVGKTEKELKQEGRDYKVAVFPWSASGRAIASDRSEGKTKLIYDPVSDRLLGAGLVGIHAGELLGEITLALEFGSSVEDIALTIHAHPTLHESVGLAAELGVGTITDLPNPKATLKK
ncbi:dihydrolipoyl dehydrogenase [Cellvibrio japonicus]|uniref:Dihydrolipoyl dehydrogenase n=1 Tax=Cellvibrio japonicus (strain Ueda107) TaxID=498211 RepID=B3PGX8_CELJU|nr:dihydrolipoyl dehydrogenase [Cellvibrio japonicus]ACE83027.1 dihydrolipoamide dehydrogenase [Cellvibrio japonicus Ueda107]QEI13782.1 dihydrolipoyl dehydrogenase [Cellvibrio japonicus]QEI17356.1 dihydrolipoyl dehydrogenase [Cellvibrio japonicus]QEI20932.1 dihydrolipoyl dehydrogenase [Cellvibrio japonicus]